MLFGYLIKILMNGIKGLVDYIGVLVVCVFKLDEFFVINFIVDLECLVWSEVEINSKEVLLIVIMKEIKVNLVIIGVFLVVVIFVFSYE